MLGGRAPGGDGLTLEFYRAFWDVMSWDMLDESLVSVVSLPLSGRRAVTHLLKNGNLQDIKNGCPVSLLCQQAGEKLWTRSWQVQ